MILNSDVVVFDGWLSSLVKSLDSHEKIGAVGTLSNSISGRQQIKTTYKNEDEYIEFAKALNKKQRQDFTKTKIGWLCYFVKKSL